MNSFRSAINFEYLIARYYVYFDFWACPLTASKPDSESIRFEQFQTRLNKTYNIDLIELYFRLEFLPNLRNICQAIKTSTTLRPLYFDCWLGEADLLLLGESLA
jgi:hypothetical protein